MRANTRDRAYLLLGERTEAHWGFIRWLARFRVSRRAARRISAARDKADRDDDVCPIARSGRERELPSGGEA